MSDVTPKRSRPVRPDDDTLRLAVQIADEVFSSPALADGSLYQIKIEMTPSSEAVTIAEPGRRQLRDLLGLVRKFDMRSSDVRLSRLFEIVERVGVKPDWRDGFDEARRAFAALDEVHELKIQDPDEPPTDSPTWIRPREAFGLWAYGEVIHNDYGKELRWERLGPVRQGLVRQMAHDYLGGLLEQAAFMRRLVTHGLERSVLAD